MSDESKTGDLPSDVQETLMEFPCAFPLKVFVKPDADVDQQILSCLAPHIGVLPLSAVQRKVSRTGKFISLTVNFTATSKPQVDAVFAALQEHPLVVMAM